MKPEPRLSPEIEAQYRKVAREMFRQHGKGIYIAPQFHVVIQDELRKAKEE
jgi:spermidine synthase